jgi:hypothetical protein
MAKRIFYLLILILVPAINLAATTDYLILQDIGRYKLSQPEKLIPGFSPTGGPRTYDSAGVIAGAGHFAFDHTDKTYEVMYLGGDANASPTVQVTMHADSPDALRWLLHEVDKSFRTYYGIPGDPYATRVVDGNTIMAYGSAGWTYRWLSGNKVIQVEYHDSQMTKTEPFEVVKAYLSKHPSTLTAMTSTDLRTVENKTKWIKEEMDRRLWLCDKWFLQITLRKADEKQVYQEAVKSMNVFLDYREKYYRMKAADEKNILAGYLNTNNGTGIKAKLAEYKNWWAVNKDKPVSIQ